MKGLVSLVSFVLLPPPIAPQSEDELPRDDVLQWADGFMLVYSIVDRSSFRYLRLLRQHLQTALPALQRAAQAAGGSAPGATPMHPVGPPPVCIVANKADLIHLRQVRELFLCTIPRVDQLHDIVTSRCL